MAQEPLTETLRETLALFPESGTPQTTTEVAERLELGRRATYGRLERLVERRRLETKKVGANARVWWRPRTEPAATGGASVRSLVGDAVDAAAVGVVVLDGNADVAWVNEATERYFGLERTRVLGTDARELVEERIAPVVADAAAFAEAASSNRDDGDAARFECHVTPGDGREERWLERRSRQIRAGPYAGGRVELYYDVTERERTERARRDERREFSSFVEAVEEYAIFTLGPEGDVRTWNTGAERIKGYAEDEIVGDHVSTFYTDEDREAGVPEANLAAAAADGSVDVEGWRVRSDGSRFWADLTLTAIRDDGGELVGYAKVTRDMSDRRERERQLRRERDLNDRIVETAPVRLVVFDADGRVERMNSQARRELGVDASDGDVIGSVRLVDADGDRIPGADHPVRDVIATGDPVSDVVLRHVGPDGERRWVSLTASPLFDEDGGVARVVVAAKDITELKETERRLERRRKELETELTEVFGRVDDAFYALDGEMRFVYVNDRATELLGRSESELLGRNAWNALSVDDDDPIRERYREAMTTQEQTTFERFSEPLGTWVTVSVYPSESGLSVYFTDITERKERERRLEQYERIVETVEDGIYVVDENLRIRQVNEAYASITGYGREELLGAHISTVVDEDVVEFTRNRRARMSDDDRSGTAEVELKTADGRRVTVEAHYSRTVDEDGAFDGTVGVVRDVTERRKRERELEEYRRWNRTLIENFPNGVVALVDENLRYVTVGGTPEGDANVTSEDLEGEYVCEALPPQIADVVVPRYEAALDGDASEFEATIDDEVYQFHFVPVRDDAGDVFAATGMSQDVTERKRREQELRDAKLQLETATEAGAVGTWEWHVREDRLVADASFARQFGVAPDAAREGVSPERLLSAIHEVDQSRIERSVEESLASCGAYEAEFRVENADGEYRWVVARGHVTCDEDGDPVSFPGALTDITERKEAELELERRTQQLSALNNLNEVFRDITEAVVDQSSREEIEETVCERLAASESYCFAWTGDIDVPTQAVQLRVEAGVEGYLDGVTISVDPDDERSLGPTGRALRTGEVQTTRDVDADARLDLWREHLERYGFRSSAAIPIVHENAVYGVLNVYTERPNGFEDQERRVVGQLGEVVGHAIAAAERERALLSDEVVELEFHVRDALGRFGIDGAPAAPITFERAIPVRAGRYLLFGTTSSEAVPTLEAMVEASPYWEAVRFGGNDEETTFEIRLTDPPLLSVLGTHGGTFDGGVVEDGDIDVTVRLPAEGDVRRVVDAFREIYPGAVLQKRTQAARRTDAVSLSDGGSLDDLTDRQRVALETAHYAGFFEWPREATGEDVAESLGVAPPTFHQHLRVAEQKVFDALFESSTPLAG